jgi:hypothetical protein
VRYAYALKAPVQDYKFPAWVTVHNAELAGAVLVIILLAFAVLRLSKGSKVPPPAPAPKPSGGGGKLLLAAAAVVGGLLAWGHYKPAAAGAKAAPAPSPSPTPTVTRTLAPHSVTHITLPHLTGTNLVWIFVIAAVVAIVLLGPVLRKRGD